MTDQIYDDGFNRLRDRMHAQYPLQVSKGYRWETNCDKDPKKLKKNS